MLKQGHLMKRSLTLLRERWLQFSNLLLKQLPSATDILFILLTVGNSNINSKNNTHISIREGSVFWCQIPLRLRFLPLELRLSLYTVEQWSLLGPYVAFPAEAPL